MLLRALLTLLVGLSLMAAPALAGTMHSGPDGCAMAGMTGSASDVAAHHHPGAAAGTAHDHEHGPKTARSMAPCCIAGCLALTLPDAAPAEAPRAPVLAAPRLAVLSGQTREPADPPPRPNFLRT